MDLVRQRIRSFLKLNSLAEAPAFRFIERTIASEFTRSLIQYSAPDGDQIEAFLFEPTGGKLSGAVLALHQHNSQWAIGKSEIAGLAGDPLQAFGPALARRGVTVLAPDSLGFESRYKTAGWGASLSPPLSKPNSTAEGWLQYYNAMAHRLVQGDLLIRKVLDDSALALSALRSQVAGSSLGVIGHSFGGIVSLFLAALDTQVAYACSSGAVCSFRHKLAHGTALDMSLVIPSFAERFELSDLMQCVAPRKLLVVSSEADPQTADAEDLVQEVLPAFEQQGCRGNLKHLRVRGQHALDQTRFEAIIEWIVACCGSC